MTDWLKAFSTHETRSVGVSVEVMIWIVQPQLTTQRNKLFLMASFKTKKFFHENFLCSPQFMLTDGAF